MSDHYFAPNPASRDDRRHTWTATLVGRTLRFTSAEGVFSKGHVDLGTRILLEAMVIPPSGTFLDLGCGYGPIGLYLALERPTATVVMVDVNERACDLARLNAVANGLSNVEVHQGDGFQPVTGRQFDLIATNPPIRAGKQVIYSLLEAARQHLTPEGSLWVVIRTQQGAKSLRKKLEEIYPIVTEISKESGYRVYQAALHA